MNPDVNVLCSSVTRITSLDSSTLEYHSLPLDGWARGDSW